MIPTIKGLDNKKKNSMYIFSISEGKNRLKLQNKSFSEKQTNIYIKMN